MARLFSPAYDPAHDPFAGTVDDISSWYHVQSISKGGTRFNDLIAPSAANFPDALAGTPSRYFLYVPMRIDRSDLAGSRPIVVKDETLATTLTRVTGSPSNNEYRIPPENSIRRNTLELHSGQAGHTISYDYYGEGSMFTSEEWNKKQWINYHTITADYTVLDDDWYREIHVLHSSSTPKITVLLPTAAANNGRRLRIQNTGLGLTIVDGEGAETISLMGNSLTTIPLFMKDNFVELLCNGTGWNVLHTNISYISSWVNKSDYTSAKINSAFTYDNKSAAVDLTGQHITEATSLQKAVVLYDSGGTGAAGKLYVYAIDDTATGNGKGYWTNNRQITCGAGGYTLDVDEGSGTSKNNNTYNIYHGLSISQIFYDVLLLLSTTASYTDCYRIHVFNDAGNYGIGWQQVGVNESSLYTGSSGFNMWTGAGSSVAIAAQDYYINILIKLTI